MARATEPIEVVHQWSPGWRVGLNHRPVWICKAVDILTRGLGPAKPEF